MLFYTTIHAKTLQLLKDLQNSERLEDFILVGGTSLALQIGHRISIDLDLFTDKKFDVSEIPGVIQHLGNIKILKQSSVILNLFIDEIKVDFVSYRYKFLSPALIIDNLRLAPISDIAAMKLAAITGRGSRKDFIDLYFILKKYSLPEIFEFYRQKYPDGSEFLVYKSLTYFDDAELEPMPKMLITINWDDIKSEIIDQVKNNFP